MNYELIINSPELNEIPKKFKIKEHAFFHVKDATLIINAFDSSKDPICPATDFDKGFTVGIKLDGECREIEKVTDLSFNVKRDPWQLGEYTTIKEDATVKELIEAVNGLIQRVTKGI